MAFDVTAMADYLKQDLEIATKPVMGSKTIKMLLANKSVQFGKGKVAVTRMNQAVTFTSGTGCGFIDDAPLVLSQREIEFKRIKNSFPMCYDDLYNTVLAEALSQGQNEETLSPAIYNKVAENRAAIISAEFEKALWQGNDSITGSTSNLRFFDGYLTIATAEGTSLTTGGADVIAKLQSFVSQIPIVVRSQDDFRVFIGEDTAAALALVLYNKNMFAPGSAEVVPGTLAKIEVIPGISGTGKVFASQIGNLRAIIDKDGDETKVNFLYVEKDQLGYIRFAFGGGTQIVFPDQTYISTGF